MGKQEAQRSDVNPELQGVWHSNCEGKMIADVTVAGTDLTFKRTDYFDSDCEYPVRSISHAGKYDLAHNFKDGVNNSIIYMPGDTVSVSLETDGEVDAMNSALGKIQDEKSKDVVGATGDQQRREIDHANKVLRAGKQLEAWKRSEPKSVNKLQLEKLAAYGFTGAPAAAQGSRVGIRYEVDNNYLQIAGPAGFNRVYHK